MIVRALIAISLITMPAVGRADPKTEARQHIANARKAHAEEKYEEALNELTLAYALDPRPGLLFAIGQVHVKLGDCASATTFYKRFLATHPDASDASVARQAISKCDAVKPAKPAEPRAPVESTNPAEPTKAIGSSAPIEVPAPAPAMRSEPASPPPPIINEAWYTDWVGDGLVAIGVASGIVGGVTYLAALADRDGAVHASNYQSYTDQLDRAAREHDVSIGLGAASAVLITAGIVRYVVHGHRRSAGGALGLHRASGRAIVTWEVPW